MAGGILGVGYDNPTGGIPPPLTSVVTDTTLTGDGTAGNPLHVVQSYWNTIGNTTDTVSNLLGTLSNTNVRTITNSSVIATWFATGQIGVGLVDADTPLGRFHIRGTAATNATTSFYVENNTAARNFSIKNDLAIYRDGALWSIYPTLENESIGRSSLAAITTGASNTTMGFRAGLLLTTGQANAIFGADAGITMTSGSFNAFFGYFTGTVNTGNNNSFFGYRAGRSNTTGANNTYIGEQAGQANTTASNNTGLGTSVMYANITGANNTAFGANALVNLLSGSNNVGLGYHALVLQTTGGQNVAIGGIAAETFNGSYCTVVGYGAAGTATTAARLVCVGALSGEHIIAGADNTMLGYQSGTTLTTGVSNTVVGSLADVAAAGTNSAIALGVGAIAATNTFVAGSASAPITNVYFGTGITVAAPGSVVINATGGLGTDIAGASLSLAGGKGTSAGAPGVINFQTGTALASGIILQTLAIRATIAQTSLSLFPHAVAAGSTYELRFLELAAGGTNYVGFKAPDAINPSVMWTLPSSDSTGTQALVSNGSAILQWSPFAAASGEANWVQYSDGIGGLAASEDFKWDNATGKLILGTINVSLISMNGNDGVSDTVTLGELTASSGLIFNGGVFVGLAP